MEDPLLRDTRGALGHLRVLDLTSSSAAYCGKLFADLGAEVIKVEPPGGDPGRLEEPLSEIQSADGSGPSKFSLPFAYENANKRSLVLDLETGEGRARFRELVARSDLVLESLPVGTLRRWGLDFETLTEGLPESHPGIVVTSISGFGQTGPDCGHRSTDLIASAMGGAMTSIGSPEDPPVRLAGHQADVITATVAASSSLVALYHRDQAGKGQHVDVSSLEVMASITHIAGVGKWLEDDIIPKRIGSGLVASVPSGAYRCKDGLVYLMVNRPAHWKALAEWIHEVTGNEEVLMEEFHGPSSSRLPYRELLDIFIGDLTIQLTVDEVYHEGQRRHIAFSPIHTAKRIASDRQLAARGFFTEIETESGDPLRVPGAPYCPSYSAWAIDRPVPKVGQDTSEILSRLDTAPDRPRERKTRPSLPGVAGKGEGGALSGLRVIEFGTGLAAPWIGRILAWAGAEVIKVESHAFPDVPRLFVPPGAPELGTQPESSPWFTDWSAGKRFVSLDLRTEEGAELCRRLVDESDAVIANYSTGVLDKLGLGYERLAGRRSARKSDLVMLESSGFGETGPASRYVTWGPNIEALSGLCSFSGFPDRECTISHFAYPDPLSALHGLVVLMATLFERDRSGKGQTIHLSQFETTVASIGRVMTQFAATGQEPIRLGNREPGLAPYGCFPCQGDDRWIVLCIESEDDWHALCEMMGESERAWSGDPRFATMASRVLHQDDLESKLSAWTLTHEDYALLAAGREHGLAIGVVQNTEDMLRRDPQLAAREFFEEIPHFKKGRVTASGIPLGLTGTPGKTTQAGSSIGHDNDLVFREVLGLLTEEIEGFVARGAIEPSIQGGGK